MGAVLDILIPHHRDPAGLERSLSSIAAQDWPGAFRVLVRDDGSPEEDWAAARRVAEAFAARTRQGLLLAANPANLGRPATRNRLLEMVEAPHVAWLDCGDIWYPGKLSRQFAHLGRLAARGEDIDRIWVSCAYDWEEAGRPLRHLAQDTSGDQAMALLEGERLRAYLWTLLGTRGAFALAGRFDERLARLQDLDLFLRFVRAGGRIETVGGPPLCRYFKANAGRSAAQVQESHRIILAKNRPLLLPHPGAAARLAGRGEYGAARFAAANRDWWGMTGHLGRALLHDPGLPLRRRAGQGGTATGGVARGGPAMGEAAMGGAARGGEGPPGREGGAKAGDDPGGARLAPGPFADPFSGPGPSSGPTSGPRAALPQAMAPEAVTSETTPETPASQTVTPRTMVPEAPASQTPVSQTPASPTMACGTPAPGTVAPQAAVAAAPAMAPPGPAVPAFRSDRMRIAFVIDRLAGRGGGAERVLVDTANALAARGHAVEVVTHDLTAGPPFYPLVPGVVLSNLRPPRRGWRGPLGRIRAAAERRFAGIAPLLDRLLWESRHGGFHRRLARHLAAIRPDVAVAVLPPAMTALAAAPGPFRRAASLHNVPAEDFDNPARWDPNPRDRCLRWAALARMDAITVLLPEFRDWFPSPLQGRVTVMPNAVARVDPARLAPGAPGAQGAGRQRVVLAVGRLAQVKRHGLLLDAWARIAPDFPDWTLRILGEGPERAALEARIGRLGIGGSARLVGQSAAVGAEYLAAAILAHPAAFEGFGLAPAEALASGLPVVAFADCPGVNRLVADGVNGVLVPWPPRPPAPPPAVSLPAAAPPAGPPPAGRPSRGFGPGPEAGLLPPGPDADPVAEADPRRGADTGTDAEPGRVEALAAALAGLMRDAALRGRLGAAGPASMAPYAPQAVADRWEALLRGGPMEAGTAEDRTAEGDPAGGDPAGG